jgi:hypothetical protein
MLTWVIYWYMFEGSIYASVGNVKGNSGKIYRIHWSPFPTTRVQVVMACFLLVQFHLANDRLLQNYHQGSESRVCRALARRRGRRNGSRVGPREDCLDHRFLHICSGPCVCGPVRSNLLKPKKNARGNISESVLDKDIYKLYLYRLDEDYTSTSMKLHLLHEPAIYVWI